MAVIFTETVVHSVSRDKLLMGAGPHTIIVAYPVDFKVFADAPIFFRKAFDEAESEFTTQHKRVMDTDPKGGVRAKVPANFNYVHVDFSLTGGFVHIVEDAEVFPEHFIQNTIAGICELTVLDRAYSSKDDCARSTHQMKTRFQDGFDWVQALQ